MAAVTLLIAIVGAVTGTISFLTEREIDIRLRAEPYTEALQDVIRVGIVNGSSRGVSVVSGTLEFDGRRFARVVGIVVGGENPLYDPRLVASELADEAQLLPFDLGPGESVPAVLLWEAEPSGFAIQRRLQAAQRQASLASASGPRTFPDRLQLEINVEPGGVERVAVPISPSRIADPNVVFGYGTTFGWQVNLMVKRRLPTALVVERAFDRRPGVATLRLWGADTADPLRHASRPVTPYPARFELGDLPSGTYWYAIESRSQVVATGVFAVPCRRGRSTPRTEPALSEDCKPPPGPGGLSP